MDVEKKKGGGGKKTGTRTRRRRGTKEEEEEEKKKKKETCLEGASRDVTLEMRTPQRERTRVQAMRIGTVVK